jgi:hypothetical protein
MIDENLFDRNKNLILERMHEGYLIPLAIRSQHFTTVKKF